jgi:hypothetical protein
MAFAVLGISPLFDDVVDALGRARGSIPAANWLLALELATKRPVKGITLAVFAELLSRKTGRRT